MSSQYLIKGVSFRCSFYVKHPSLILILHCPEENPVKKHVLYWRLFNNEFGKKIKILIVEVNFAAMIAATTILKQYDIEIDKAVDGVEKATSDEYSFIIMDIRLPKLNGIEATPKLSLKASKHLFLASLLI